MDKQLYRLIKSYVIGFILSLALTLVAFFLVQSHVTSHHMAFSHEVLTVTVLALAVVQLVVQLFFFLHLANESSPRWNLAFFIATVGIVLIIVVGAMWIMYHLNYNMTPMEINNYLHEQSGF